MEKERQKQEPTKLVSIRLNQERKQWRMNKPANFTAKPLVNENGTTDLMYWICQIPGPKDSIWEEGTYNLTMEFSNEYPLKPPKQYDNMMNMIKILGQFKPPLPHPNIYPSGTVCLSILNDEEDWKPSISIKQILLGIQKLLSDEPNINSPAQLNPCQLYKFQREKYIKQAQEFALKNKKQQ